jgi:hypothetical protein
MDWLLLRRPNSRPMPSRSVLQARMLGQVEDGSTNV